MRPAGPRRRLTGRVGYSALVYLVVAYVPLGATSMWFAVLPAFPRLQQHLDTWLGGQEYATGPGSVVALRTAAYLDHRVALLVHTSFGALALCLVLLQATARCRLHRDPTTTSVGRAHRWIGRSYLVAVVICVAASFVFLLEAPHVDMPGQTAFRLQLWLLGGSTLGSALAGFVAARRGDRSSHRAWMTLSACFVLTAPVLRWMSSGLGWLVPEHTMLTNLEVSSVCLAVVAPAMGALACARQLGATAAPPVSGRGLLAIGSAGVLGGVVLTVRLHALVEEGAPLLYPCFHVGPMVLVALLVVHGRRSAPGADRGSRASCEWLAAALAVVPWTVLAASIAVRPWLDAAESLRAAVLCAPGFPFVGCMVLFVMADRQSSETRGVAVR